MFTKMNCAMVREAQENGANVEVGDYIFYDNDQTMQEDSANTFYERMTDNYPINLNWSDIRTTLVQTAGRFCESYASDVVISINWIQKMINNPESTDYHEILVFRKSGVNVFVVFPYNNGYVFATNEHQDAFEGLLSESRAIFLLHYTCTETESCDYNHPGYHMEIKCSRVD